MTKQDFNDLLKDLSQMEGKRTQEVQLRAVLLLIARLLFEIIKNLEK